MKMMKTIKLKAIGKRIGITRWSDVEIHTGYDTGGYYVDIVQNEEDENIELICANIATSENKEKIEKLFLDYDKSLNRIKKSS